MATQVIKSIGATGRDYASLQAFLDAVPSNLVASDEVWIGEIYNDAELSQSATVTGGTKTCDATRYVVLRPATGHGFADHANKLTNPLRYNAAVGAALTSSVDWATPFDLSGLPYLRVEGLQIKTTMGYVDTVIKVAGTASVRGCILYHTSANNSFVKGGSDGTTSQKIENNVFIGPGGVDSRSLVDVGWGSSIIRGNTFYIATSSNHSIYGGYGSPTITDNIAINLARTDHNPGTASYNASNIAGFPGSVATITPADVFESVTAGSLDLRIKTGAAVIGAGTPIGDLSTDILGQTRSATAPTIGAFEVVAGGGGTTISCNQGSASASGFAASILAATVISCAVGGATASGHQATVSASSPTTISCALGSASASGHQATISSGSGTTIACSVGSASASGHQATVSVAGSATITSSPFKNNTGTVLAITTIAKVAAIKLSDLTLSTTWTDQATDGSGVLTLSSALLTSATDYLLVASNADGSAVGVKKYTAT